MAAISITISLLAIDEGRINILQEKETVLWGVAEQLIKHVIRQPFLAEIEDANVEGKETGQGHDETRLAWKWGKLWEKTFYRKLDKRINIQKIPLNNKWNKIEWCNTTELWAYI